MSAFGRQNNHIHLDEKMRMLLEERMSGVSPSHSAGLGSAPESVEVNSPDKNKYPKQVTSHFLFKISKCIIHTK